jgi:5-methyltetrahydrofolate--homocysteine methyltransferase
MDPGLKLIYDGILEGDMKAAQQHVQTALDSSSRPDVILNEGMISAMSEVGRLFEEGEYFVPEMLISARAMQACLAVLKPYLVQAGVEPVGTVVIGTVQGDLHDIGKNLVAMMLEGAGFAVVDLGVDVKTEKYIMAVQEQNAEIVAMSALLTTTMPKMRTTIDALRGARGIDAKIKILVGGAPVTEAYAESIGADGYAPNASRAAALAKSLLP